MHVLARVPGFLCRHLRTGSAGEVLNDCDFPWLRQWLRLLLPFSPRLELAVASAESHYAVENDG